MTTGIAPARASVDAAAEPAEFSGLAIGDTLTVVSGCLGGAWVVEDENGGVYLTTAVE